MRYVDRSRIDVPPALGGDDFRKMRETYLRYLELPEKERVQRRQPDRHLPYSAGLNNAVIDLFEGRCAFCESRSKLEVYRFRPTSDALPQEESDFGFMAYGWLADAWQNLYTICPGCRPKRSNFFPVEGPRSPAPTASQYAAYAKANTGMWKRPVVESSLLLDPCEDKPVARHLKLAANGVLEALTVRGEATITQFNLNRDGLVNRRGEAVRQVDQRLNELELRPDVFFNLSNWLNSSEFPGLLNAYVRTRRRSEKQAAASSQKTAAAARLKPAPQPAQDPDWRLARVQIRNFKSLEKLDIDMPKRLEDAKQDYAPALLILGENALGKSSILEAIALALVSQDARENLGINVGSLLLDPTFMGGALNRRKRKATVRLDFASGDGQTRTVSLALTASGYRVTGEPPRNLPVFAYGAYRHYLNDHLDWRPERGVISLFKSDNLLSNPEKWLLQIGNRQFDMVVRSLRDIFGIGDDFAVIERDPANKRCMVVTKLSDGTYSKTPLSSVSSGFRTILALTCDVMRWLLEAGRDWTFKSLGEATGIVMIDEIEAHLHPRWKVQIIEGMRKALPRMTFIVTTHDPLCIRGMKDNEVMVLQRLEGKLLGSDLPMIVENLSQLPNASQLTIEQLLTSDLFNLFDTDDPDTGASMARLADALVNSRMGTTDPDSEDARLLRKFEREIENALPIGTTQVSQIVQSAVSDYLLKRRNIKPKERKTLRQETKDRIIAALEGRGA